MFSAKRLGYIDLDMEHNHETPDENSKSRKSPNSWWENLCLRCHQADSTPSWQPSWWTKLFPFPFFSTYRQTAQQICIIMFSMILFISIYTFNIVLNQYYQKAKSSPDKIMKPLNQRLECCYRIWTELIVVVAVSLSYPPNLIMSCLSKPSTPIVMLYLYIKCVVLLTWGILYAELGESIGLNGELLSMSLLVISAYLIGWIWLKITTLPALIGMLVTGIAFQNLHLVHMTDSYRKLNQDLRKIALVIILTRAGLGLDAAVLKKHYAAVLQLGLLPWLVECVAISVSTHYLLNLPWIWGFLLGSMIASVSPAVVVPCLFRLRDVGYGVSKGIPTIVVAAAAVDDSISVAIFAIILNAMFSTGSATFNIIKGPLSIIAGVALGSLWGAITSVIPEKGDTYVVPLRFLALFLGGLFSYFISSMIGWSGAGPLAIVSSGFVAAYFWAKQGWPVNKNPVSNIFRILWIFFEPILFAFTGAQVTISALDPQVIKMATICLVSCLVIRGVVTYFVSFGCGLNSKEKIFIGLTWTAKATVQAALGPAALDLVNNGQTSGAAKADEEYYAKTILAVSVLSVMISAPLGALLIALAGPRLLTKDDTNGIQNPDPENQQSTQI